MLHPQSGGKADGPPQFFPGPSGQPQHQVQGDVGKSRGPGVLHGPRRLPGGVGPAQQPQLLLIGRLQPHGQPVKPGLPHSLKEGPVHLGGVGLQGDLRPGGQGKAILHHPQQPGQPLRPQQAGGPPAKIYRGDLPPPQLLPPGAHSPEDGGHIGVHPLWRAGQGVKIAVGALPPAKRHVKVQTQQKITTNEKGRPAF